MEGTGRSSSSSSSDSIKIPGRSSSSSNSTKSLGRRSSSSDRTNVPGHSRYNTTVWRRRVTAATAAGVVRRQHNNDFGGQQQQCGDGGRRYVQQHPHQLHQQRQHQPRPGGTGWVGNTGSGCYQPESLPPPGASMREVYKCDRCGALGNVRYLQSTDRFCVDLRYMWSPQSHRQVIVYCHAHPYACKHCRGLSTWASTPP